MKVPECTLQCGVAFRIVLILGFCLLHINIASADRTQALFLETQGDYNQALKMWLQLANTGDPIAQYNLALLYQPESGKFADANLYKYWLSQAARNGFAEAYGLLNTQAIHATNRHVHLKMQQDPGAWLAEQNPAYYTLQLASSTRKVQIQKYYDENELSGKGGYYVTRRSGAYWYSLVYGVYPTVGDAKAAIENLPDSLKQWSPWVRNIKSLQRLMVSQP